MFSNFKVENIELCRKICAQHGKKYYIASLFFPYRKKIATWIIYAFVRIPDEMVDGQGSVNDKKVALVEWRKKWAMALVDVQQSEIVLDLALNIFTYYKIPIEYSMRFLEAMQTDLQKNRYSNYEELEDYMFGSAVVVGYFMCYIVGFKGEALRYAKMLGEAMQVTNFLRDIKEDLINRDRIYFPQNELNKFKLSDEDLKSENLSKNFKNFMKYQIQRARRLYFESIKGVKYLDSDGQLAVLLSAKLYEKILDKIEEADYDIYTKRLEVSRIEKIKITIYTIWNKKKIIHNSKAF